MASAVARSIGANVAELQAYVVGEVGDTY